MDKCQSIFLQWEFFKKNNSRGGKCGLFKRQFGMGHAYNLRGLKEQKWLKCGQINTSFKFSLKNSELTHIRPTDIDSLSYRLHMFINSSA